MSDMRHLLDIIEESEFYKEDIEVGDNFDLEFAEDLLIETFVVEVEDDSIILEGDDKVIELLNEYGFDLEEGDVIKGNFPSLGADRADKSDKIDYKGLYKEFITSQNYKLAKTKGQIEDDDNWETLAVGYLKSKGYDKLHPRLLGNMSQRLLSMHKAYQKGHDHAAEGMSKILEGISKVEKIDRDIKEDDMDEAKYQGREVPLGKPMAGDVKKKKVYVKKPNGKVVKVNFGDKKMRIKKSNPKRRKSFRARHNCKNPGPRWKARYWSCRAW